MGKESKPKLSQQRMVQVVGISALALLALIVIPTVLKKPSGSQQQVQQKQVESVANIITKADSEALGRSALDREVDQLKGAVDSLIEQNAAATAAGDHAGPSREAVELTRQLNAMRQEIAELRAERAAPGDTSNPSFSQSLPDRPTTTRPTGVPTGSITGTYQGEQGRQGAVNVAPPRIRRIGGTVPDPTEPDLGATEVAPDQPSNATPKTAESFLPQGSLITGVLINGLDAPTGRGVSSEPVPVVVRITHEAILPNHASLDLRECFIVASGFGNLSSERAQLRSEAMSCVNEDGEVMETPVEMVAIGEDGKTGLRGRMVTKQGIALRRAAMAGILDSVSRSQQPAVGVLGGGVGSGTLQSGALAGASNALDRIAQFYLDLAEQTFPIIEIDAMREVTFMVVKGRELRFGS